MAEWEDGLLAFFALGSSIAVSNHHPTLAVALFVGGLVTAFRGVRASVLRWELLENLRRERDAYAIEEVRRAAEKAATPENRRLMASTVRLMLERQGPAAADRLAPCAGELSGLAEDLEDPALVLDPTCAVECEHLLSDAGVSPLLNPALPMEDVHSALCRIRAGFSRSSG